MILHVDMDAYYASVEERDRPELVGRPIVVGGSAEGRGVVAAANYVARQFGVHSAMPAITARRLCPQAVFIRPRMERYATISRQIREVFHRFTPLVEPLSLDEAFLDVTGCTQLFGPVTDIGRQVKSTIMDETGLVASVGVAPNKFLAKLASDLEKPDGFVVVEKSGVQGFLDPLPVSRLWGVGKSAQRVFERLGIATVGQLRQLDESVLTDHFGSHGRHLWRLARGIDERSVVPDHVAKSISHETTFAVDIEEIVVLESWLMELTEQVARRLRRHELRGNTVQLKLRYGDFTTITRAQKLNEPTNLTDEIWRAGREMLRNRLPNRRLSVRLLGIGVTGIVTHGWVQKGLFDDDAREKMGRVDAVSDEIKDRFGRGAVSRAKSLGQHHRKDPGSESD